jgi:uncharacterized membrane protein YidH (DUF202 family)
LSPRCSQTSTGKPATVAPELNDPGLARDRTALAWTRSALNVAASGALIARAGFAAHLDTLGLASAIAMGTIAVLTWRHGQALYRDRSGPVMPRLHQTAALGLLTAATLLIAAFAIIVTIAI